MLDTPRYQINQNKYKTKIKLFWKKLKKIQTFFFFHSWIGKVFNWMEPKEKPHQSAECRLLRHSSWTTWENHTCLAGVWQDLLCCFYYLENDGYMNPRAVKSPFPEGPHITCFQEGFLYGTINQSLFRIYYCV